ncbi:MAG: hypothetical protein N3E40_06235 [Dehalococcoidia bacterium]|nr:hypothetical protein [Dehalococcoidia bacterium]
MRKRYFIELSRQDLALVSYCPGLEIRGKRTLDWTHQVLTPAIEPLAARRAWKIVNTPITFWVTVRRTARRPAEVFLFMTPAYPGALIERAMEKALSPIKEINVHAAREPIPEYAYPCLQVFRRKLIRFYIKLESNGDFFTPMVVWKNKGPELVGLSIPKDHHLINLKEPVEVLPRFFAEAKLSTVMDGEHYRRYQQVLAPVALPVE